MPPRRLVFPLTGVEVPPRAVFSAGDDPTDGISGSADETPSWWPTRGKAHAIEVEVTAIDEQTQDGQVRVVMSTLPGIDEVPGTWSGDAGQVDTFALTDASMWEFTKFGGWRTEYLQRNSPNLTGDLITYSSAMNAAVIDVRARVRHGDWSASSGLGRRIVAREGSGGTAGPWTLRRESTGLFWQSIDSGSELDTVTATIADLGLVNDQWIWVRVLTSPSTAPRMFTSSDGSSWSEATTTRVGSGTPGGNLNSSTNGIRVGGSAGSGGGFEGDISHAYVYSGGGTLLADLSLDAMDSQTDTSWTDRAGNTVTRGQGSTVGSTIPATRRARFEFTDPTDVQNWRAFVDTDSPATVSVDEVVVEVDNRNRRGPGLMR